METTTAHPPATAVPVRGPRATLWLLRVTATVQAGLVLVQPVLAGWYLSGDYDALSAHAANAGYVGYGVIASLISTLLYWLPGRGRGGPFLVAVAVFVALVFQFGAGYGRNLALHIPLGVAIVTASVLFGIWAWRPAARRARRPFRWPR
ncbi:MAG: hypothetical protein ACRDRX_17335 [Pseudonocardiaceae bacterium]